MEMVVVASIVVGGQNDVEDPLIDRGERDVDQDLPFVGLRGVRVVLPMIEQVVALPAAGAELREVNRARITMFRNQIGAADHAAVEHADVRDLIDIMGLQNVSEFVELNS